MKMAMAQRRFSAGESAAFMAAMSWRRASRRAWARLDA